MNSLTRKQIKKPRKADEVIAKSIRDNFTSGNELDSNLETANVVDGLFAIARAIDGLTGAIYKLGLGEASTPLGALEVISKEIKDGLSSISEALKDK